MKFNVKYLVNLFILFSLEITLLFPSPVVCLRGKSNSYLKDYFHRKSAMKNNPYQWTGRRREYKFNENRKVYSTRNSPNTALDNLIYKLNDGNERLTDIINLNFGSTVNEVDDSIDYYADQKDVHRAWSKGSKMKQHTRDVNLHIIRLATQNVQMVMETAKCEQPTRRCLDVRKMSISVNKTKNYWPNCALVHKCDHDSGCCKDPKHICSPIETEPIKLHFFIFDIQETKNGSVAVERLTFENHTLCGCRPSLQKSLDDRKDCACPKKFYTIISDGECRCNCETKKNKPCRRIKRGRRTYNMRGCRNSKCSPPECDFGIFMADLGRCPKKSERANKLQNDMYNDK